MELRIDGDTVGMSERTCPHCKNKDFNLETDGLKDYVVCTTCSFPVGELVPFELSERHLFPPEVCPI